MSEFIQRHIGPSESEQRKMLADLGLSTIDELVREIVPDTILRIICTVERVQYIKSLTTMTSQKLVKYIIQRCL